MVARVRVVCQGTSREWQEGEGKKKIVSVSLALSYSVGRLSALVPCADDCCAHFLP